MSTPVIYLVDASTAVTGAFICARNEARALAGDARFVLVLPQGSAIPPEALRDFWRVDYLPILTLSKNPATLCRYFPALLHASWQLRKRMTKDGSTRLQLNDFYLLHGMVLRLMGFRGHSVSWVRCNPRAFTGFMARPVLWLVRHSANRLIAVSSYIRSFLPSHYPVALVYDYYSPHLPPRIWEPRQYKTFVFIGNYIEGKGQDVALEAFAIAHAEDPSLRLAYYGGDMGLPKNRDYRLRLETAAREKGLTGVVTFGGFLPNPATILAQEAYAALNFSYGESFSMTVLEASGMGVPVIATASGGPQEIIQDGVTGFLIPVGDVKAAAAKILALAQDPEKAACMGQAGADHIRQRFSLERFRDAIMPRLRLTAQES